MSDAPPAADAPPPNPPGISTLVDLARLQADEAPLIAKALRQASDHGEKSDLQEPVRDPISGFTLLRELGRGGQGVVFEAAQNSTGRKVAIKVLHELFLQSDPARRRFEREIDLIVRLKHPGIISVIDSGKTRLGRPYFAMEFVQGVSIHKFVREERLTLEATLTLFLDVCDAVQFAHQQGVIHRDLKPSNILVDHLGKPRVMDFGLAKWVGEDEQEQLTLTQSVVGTLPYMSPEQTRGKIGDVDSRTDIYALGVILYELLTGQYPYAVVNNLAEVLRQFAEFEPTPATRRWARDRGVTQRSSRRIRANECPIDDEVQLIVMHALHKDRQRRFQTAHDMASEVRRYLAGQPIGIKGDSIWYLVRKKAARHKTLAAAVGLMLVSNFGWGVFGLNRYFAAMSAQDAQSAAWRQSQMQYADFKGVADRAAQNRREIANRTTLGWLHSEWQAGRLQSANQIRALLDRDSPESAAAAFLLDPSADEASLLAGIATQDADWAWFAIGERRTRLGGTREAKWAFERVLDLTGSELLRLMAKQRLSELRQTTVTQPASPSAEGATQVGQ